MTLIWQPCVLELNSDKGSVLIKIQLRAKRKWKILALCKHTQRITSETYFHLKQKSNFLNGFTILLLQFVGLPHEFLHIKQLDERTTMPILNEDHHFSNTIENGSYLHVWKLHAGSQNMKKWYSWMKSAETPARAHPQGQNYLWSITIKYWDNVANLFTFSIPINITFLIHSCPRKLSNEKKRK